MNITEDEEIEIHANLPDLVNHLYDGKSEAYTLAFTCVFDHWLEGEEFYRIFEADAIEVKERQNKFKALIHHLYESTPIYTARFRRNRKDSLSIKKIRNSKILDKKCRFHILNEDFGEQFKFIIPEYSLIYTQYFDWTHLTEYCNDEKYKKFRMLAKKFDLHCLDS